MKKLTLSSVVVAVALVLAIGFATVADAQVTTTTTAQQRTVIMNGMWPYLNARTDMSMGMTGAGVVALQNYLNAADFLGANQYTPGVFDLATKNAVQNYQANSRVMSTGYFGPHSQAHMTISLLFRAMGVNRI
ncbi:MAG: putative peptidoglycan binding domain [Candidatus Parcubacteria bacterium]|jgi:peptidoglycan hydrolase-like protein with peptidoglycan-binding domain